MNPTFENYEIDRQALELRCDGSRVEIAPMPVRVLIYLVDHSDRLVERQELYEAFWPEGGVDRERLLNTYVRQIRSALGERAGENRFLRTYPRRGYRFVARVHAPTGVVGPDRDAAPRRTRRTLAVAAAVGVVAAIGVVYWPTSAPTVASSQTSIEYEMGEELLADPSPATRATAADHFRRALRQDPDQAAAHSGLAVSLFWAGDAVAAEGAARNALALAPGESRAHLALGASLLQSKWDWTDAEFHLRRAVEIAPHDPAPRSALAYLLVAAGRSIEGREMLDAVARLEPTAPIITGDLGLMYGWLGDHRSARELCRRTIALEPGASWAHECILRAARALGDSAEVHVRSERLVALMGGDVQEVFGDAVGVGGRLQATWRYLLGEAETSSPLNTAIVLAELGRASEAITELERAALQREAGVPALGVIPALRTLANDPRYERLVRQVRGS